MCDKSLELAIYRLIKKHTNLVVTNGFIEYEIYADYRDTLDKSVIKEIFSSDNPRKHFADMIMSAFEIPFGEAQDYIIGEIQSKWSSTKFPYDKYKDDIEDWVSEHISIIYPTNHYLNQNVCVDIVVDTGDANYDFVSNCVYPHYNGNIDDGVPNEASILWLAKQQGYKKTNLIHALKHPESTGSKLLKSIRREVLNCTSHMNALVFLVKMTLEELFDLYEKNNNIYQTGSIMLKKNSVCGLYDAWSGAGSLLDIELEQDVILPIRYIHSVTPDCLMQQYNIAEVYGVSSNLWAPTIVLNPKKEVA